MFNRVTRVFLVATALTIGMVGTAAAQSGVGVGVKGGVVFPQFNSDVIKIDNRIGWQAGIFVGGNRQGVAGVQAEFNYLRKRGESAILGTEATLNYLQIPILLKLHSPSRSASGFQFYGIVGPSFDFKVSETFEGVNFTDGFEGTDVGLMVGAGVEAGRIIFEGRYSRGLRQVNKNFNFNDAVELKSHSFAVLLGVRFN